MELHTANLNKYMYSISYIVLSFLFRILHQKPQSRWRKLNMFTKYNKFDDNVLSVIKHQIDRIAARIHIFLSTDTRLSEVQQGDGQLYFQKLNDLLNVSSHNYVISQYFLPQ